MGCAGWLEAALQVPDRISAIPRNDSGVLRNLGQLRRSSTGLP